MRDVPDQLTVHSNFWIERGGEVVLSRWRVQLLEAIEATGSITAAADRMGIQYRLAWERLDEMEHGLGERLVDRHVGGAGGGGARLTDTGRELVGRFSLFADRVERILAQEFSSSFGPLIET